VQRLGEGPAQRLKKLVTLTLLIEELYDFEVGRRIDRDGDSRLVASQIANQFLSQAMFVAEAPADCENALEQTTD
jgi:hypothetical protein